MHPQPNEGKQLNLATDFGVFERRPIRTHVVQPNEPLDDLMRHYVVGQTRPGDVLFLSEKVVAISQGRAYPMDEIRPSRLARVLSRFVHRSPYGIGLALPETMQLALEDVGVPRMLLAALCSAVTKPFGLRGVFYRVAGAGARAVDGPCEWTLPPFNTYAKKAPAAPGKVAQDLSALVGVPVVIIDANDLGVDILGKSSDALSDAFCKAVFADNPLGQGSETTPMAIVRPSCGGAFGSERQVS